MNKILISAPYMLREKEEVEKLFEGSPVDLHWADVKERLEEKELLTIISSYSGIICGDDRITRKVIDSAINLKIIVKWGTGIDSIDSEYAINKNIIVKNTPGAFNNPVADTTLGVMLYFVRSLKENIELMNEGKWEKPKSFTLAEKSVGIIGLGNIGMAVAKRLYGFDTRILANDILEIDSSFINAYGVEMVSKEEMFEKCDIITLHCDLNETSKHLLNKTSFNMMKKRPFIINNARGPLIDEKAIIQALNDNVISGAGLDVFEDEPLSKDSPLRTMENVALSSHNSNSSPRYWQKIHENSVKMLLKGLAIE